jgi:hypothetical protein
MATAGWPAAGSLIRRVVSGLYFSIAEIPAIGTDVIATIPFNCLAGAIDGTEDFS